jgi:hypothetical protein
VVVTVIVTGAGVKTPVAVAVVTVADVTTVFVMTNVAVVETMTVDVDGAGMTQEQMADRSAVDNRIVHLVLGLAVSRRPRG